MLTSKLLYGLPDLVFGLSGRLRSALVLLSMLPRELLSYKLLLLRTFFNWFCREDATAAALALSRTSYMSLQEVEPSATSGSGSPRPMTAAL